MNEELKNYLDAKFEELRLELQATSKVMTLEECAKMVGLSKDRIYRLIYAEKIPYHKPSGVKGYRFDRIEIQDWLLNRKGLKTAAVKPSDVIYR